MQRHTIRSALQEGNVVSREVTFFVCIGVTVCVLSVCCVYMCVCVSVCVCVRAGFEPNPVRFVPFAEVSSVRWGSLPSISMIYVIQGSFVVVCVCRTGFTFKLGIYVCICIIIMLIYIIRSRFYQNRKRFGNCVSFCFVVAVCFWCYCCCFCCFYCNVLYFYFCICFTVTVSVYSVFLLL